MSKKTLEQIVTRMENHLECWKQFNQFMSLARTRKFSAEDESQFLEIKCVLTQDLEAILCAMEGAPVHREEVHALIAAAPSIRYLSEIDDGNLRTLENQWHKMFINWQAVLGQLKVRKQELDSQSLFASLFGSRKKDK